MEEHFPHEDSFKSWVKEFDREKERFFKVLLSVNFSFHCILFIHAVVLMVILDYRSKKITWPEADNTKKIGLYAGYKD